MPAPETPWQGGRIDRRAVAGAAVRADVRGQRRGAGGFRAGRTNLLHRLGGMHVLRPGRPRRRRDRRRHQSGAGRVRPAAPRSEAIERGRIDRRFDQMRQIAPALGWTRATLERFCDLDETDEQLEFWRRRRHPPAAARACGRLQPKAASAHLRPAVRRRPPCSIRSHPPPQARARIRSSPERRKPVRIGAAARPHEDTTPAPLAVESADAIDFLEACAPGSFDGITLSNILDGADRDYSARLFDAVRRAAAPGAVMIARLPRAHRRRRARWAARDQALFWGSIRVERL